MSAGRTKLKVLFLVVVAALIAMPATVLAGGSEDFAYVESDGEITITDYLGEHAEVEIPATIDGKPVTAIDAGAFKGDPITSVILPASVASVGDEAFSGCSILDQAVFSGDAPATAGSGIFEKCDADFTIYYASGAAGWTNPWNGYAAKAFDPTAAHSVTYDGNGADKGTVPTDSETYINGDPVTVQGNTGHLKKQSYTFAGWSTRADGQGAKYTDGSKLKMGVTDVVLYAVWEIRLSAASAKLDLASMDFGDSGEGTHMLRIEMHDSFGDGWNYGEIEIYLNGDYITSATLPDDEEEGTANIYGLVEGDELSFVWIEGEYDDEVSFEIYCESYDASFSALVCSCDASDLFSDATFCTYTVGDDSGTIVGGQEEWEQDGVTWYYRAQETTCSVIGCSQQTGALIIPAVINGYSVTHISEGAFIQSGISSVVIPEGVTTISFIAFALCENLQSVTLPASLITIGDYAFAECSSLSGITIPQNVSDIESGVFLKCSSLTSIGVHASNTSYTAVGGVLFSMDKKVLVAYPSGKSGVYSIPSGTLEIASGAFGGSSLLTSITLPSSLKTIGLNAFWGCEQLTSISIPAAVTSIGGSAFEGCTKLTAINVSSSNANYMSSSGVLFNKNGKTLLQCPAGKSGSYSIPSTVHIIGEFAFSGCAKLTSVTIPTSVDEVGAYAFQGCTKLTSITIPNGVEEIGYYAFAGCSGLKTVSISASVEYIGYLAFDECPSITAFTVSSSNIYFSSQDGVLFDKDREVLVYYPVGNTRTSYTIPDGVGYIDSNAFAGSVYLTVVKIPASVEYLDYAAFANCANLSEAHFRGDAPAFYQVETCFSDAADNFRIYYPQGASGWTTPTWNGYTTVVELGVPAISSAVSARYDSVALTWSAVAEATGYEIYYATSQTGTYTLAGSVSSGTLNYTVGTLTAGKTYWFMVRAYKTGGVIQYSDYSSAKSAMPIPSVPTGAAAAMASYNSIRVSWNAVEGASGYKVYRATSADGTYSLVKTTTVTSYTNTYLSTGRTYYYKVRAYRYVSGRNVYGNYCDIVSATPVLSSVTSASAAAYYPTSIKISWSAVPGRTKYEVWRSTAEDGEYTLVGTTSYTYYKNTGLTPFVTYYYKIRVYRSVSRQKVYGGDFSPIASATPILNDVTNVAAASYSSSSVKVSWSAVYGASGYEVWRSDTADGEYTLIKSTTYKYYTNSYLEPNRTYHYKVVAYRTVGSARIYSAVCAPVSAAPYLGPVTNAKAARYSTTKIKLTWSAVSGRTGYEIYRSEAPDGEFVSIGTTTYTYYYSAGLTSGVPYYYKIRAYKTVNGVRYYSEELAGVTAVSATP